MPVRNADATWDGGLKDGHGKVKLGSGAFEGSFSFSTRFENAPGTNPEELIAAAHAGCFSMALSAGLGKGGFTPKHIHTAAKVHIDKVGEGFKITKIELTTEASIPGIENGVFQEYVAKTKTGCPVSQALASVPIEVKATLS